MRRYFFTVLMLLSMLLAACESGSNGAPKAVEDYLKALTNRDENGAVNAACAAWEEQARQEFNAFSAVKLEMKDVACSQSGTDGAIALVKCRGAILANYGQEDQKIDVAERTYAVVNENGQWRMCGYR